MYFFGVPTSDGRCRSTEKVKWNPYRDRSDYPAAMVHLRIVVPFDRSRRAMALLEAAPSVCNLIFLPEAARQPTGDVILCDVAREDASVVIDDLKELGVHHDGSIALEQIDSQLSDTAERAERAARGSPSDAVVW